MKSLLNLAEKRSDQAETYRIKEESTLIQFQGSSLHSINNTIQSATSLRMIKDKKLGFAYTRNLRSEEQLLKNAEKSLLGEVDAQYNFPHSPLVEELDSYDAGIENLQAAEIAEECRRLSDYIRRHSDAEIDIYASKDITEIEILNTNGTTLTHKSSIYSLYFTLIYPGSASGISYYLQGKNFVELKREVLELVTARYKSGLPLVSPQGGNMQVLFLPMTLYALTWRLAIGLSSKSYYDKTTPIADKQGIRIFDSKLTLFTDPLDDRYPGSRPFDDEGVVCHRHILINSGEFVKRYNDLNYAAKLKEKPTGHGYRRSMTALPSPSAAYLHLSPGHSSYEDMVQGIKRGVILCNILGAHSGNLANGDFSIGVSPALYVENGKIIGRLKEGMVSGNIYKILKNVDAIENKLYPSNSGMMPSLLLDGVRVDI